MRDTLPAYTPLDPQTTRTAEASPDGGSLRPLGSASLIQKNTPHTAPLSVHQLLLLDGGIRVCGPNLKASKMTGHSNPW